VGLIYAGPPFFFTHFSPLLLFLGDCNLYRIISCSLGPFHEYVGSSYIVTWVSLSGCCLGLGAEWWNGIIGMIVAR